MTYLLDTNTCIRFLNGRSDSIRRRFDSLEASDLSLCSIVKAELLYGAVKSARPEENLEKLSQFFQRFVSLPFDDSAAEMYGRIRTRLEKHGKPIGANDLLIASIALTNRHVLVTHNLGEFGRIEELVLEDWE
jgi:tRNA(fMet)-specific endonuclease VapC